MSFENPEEKKSKWKTESVTLILKEAMEEKDILQKGLVLEKTKNHGIYPYLVDGFGEIMNFHMKNKTPQSEMLNDINKYLQGVINNFNKVN